MRLGTTLLTLGFALQYGALVANAQIAAGQVDDFQQGGSQGWVEGPISPNPPQLVTSGGPEGDDDAYLQDRSSGINGPGGRMIVFNNQPRWRGDYLDAGIAALEVDLNNQGNTPLTMRFDLVRGNPSFPANHVFTQGFEIEPGSGWQQATFSLNIDDLFSGSDISNILSDVTELRLVHEPATPPMHPGAPVSGQLGIDNIRAVGTPVMEDVPGDYNDNGRVEQADLDLVLLNWNEPVDNLPDTWVNERPTGGIIDQAELDGVLLNWNRTVPGPAAVRPPEVGVAAIPEPATWILSGIGVLAAVMFRRASSGPGRGSPRAENPPGLR